MKAISGMVPPLAIVLVQMPWASAPPKSAPTRPTVTQRPDLFAAATLIGP